MVIAGAALAFIQAARGQGGSGLSPHVASGVAPLAGVAASFADFPGPAVGAAASFADFAGPPVGPATPGALVVGAAAASDLRANAIPAGVSVSSLGAVPSTCRGSSSQAQAPAPSASAAIRRTPGLTAMRHDSNRSRASAMASPAMPPVPTLVEIIAAKRDGAPGNPADVARLVAALMSGELADYQMAAWLMAVFFRGLSDPETVAMTEAMLRSGRVLDLSRVRGLKVDKHSTGGVGDKVSVTLAPLVAACGVPVPMVCGRGLGHTGGTVDKLEAIPGFRAQLDAAEFAAIVERVGCCMIGQTAEIAPADKRIYALRDVTATVESIPLIVASILSKKLAEGIDALVLDVKVGRGAFMKEVSAARTLAKALVRVGSRAGKKVVALLTDMEAPLGVAVGNAIETAEALDVLAGGGPPDLVACTLALGAEMLVLGGKAGGVGAARALLAQAIASGRAARVAEQMIEAQGGDPRVVADRRRLAVAEEELVIEAARDGYVDRVDALAIGLAAVAMGAGRSRADQPVDHGVGIYVEKKPGDAVRASEPLARLRVRSGAAALPIAERVREAFAIADTAPPLRPLVLDRIDDRSSTAAPGSG